MKPRFLGWALCALIAVAYGLQQSTPVMASPAQQTNCRRVIIAPMVSIWQCDVAPTVDSPVNSEEPQPPEEPAIPLENPVCAGLREQRAQQQEMVNAAQGDLDNKKDDAAGKLIIYQQALDARVNAQAVESERAAELAMARADLALARKSRDTSAGELAAAEAAVSAAEAAYSAAQHALINAQAQEKAAIASYDAAEAAKFYAWGLLAQAQRQLAEIDRQLAAAGCSPDPSAA